MKHLTEKCGEHVQMLSQVLRTLMALHSEGFAHRNIKPSNILRRPMQHDWILVDFASTAPVGARTRPSTSPLTIVGLTVPRHEARVPVLTTQPCN